MDLSSSEINQETASETTQGWPGRGINMLKTNRPPIIKRPTPSQTPDIPSGMVIKRLRR